MIRRTVRIFAVAAVYAVVAAACVAGGDDGVPLAVSSAPTQGTATQDTAAQGTACSYTSPRGVADARETITSNGVERQYLVHVPPTYPRSYDGFAPAPAPLLVAFHGAGSNAQFTADMTALATAADAHDMVVVFPEARGTPQVWNVYGSSDPTGDLAFGVDVLEQVMASLCIDPARVYTTGFSVGGGMALLLACEHPELIASVATVAAPYLSCQADVPLIAFHGAEDPIAPYVGRNSATGDGQLPAVERAVADWAQALGCDRVAMKSRPAAEVELSTHGGCSNGDGEALLYTVLGGGHTWPGAAIELPTEIAGVTTHAISATDLMLAFFESHRR